MSILMQFRLVFNTNSTRCRKRHLQLVFGTRYELDGDVVLECLYEFEFEVKNLRQFIVYNEDQSITVNHIMPHFLSVAIGTMRGILVVKTAGTNCAKYPLPMINVNQLNVNLSSKE